MRVCRNFCVCVYKRCGGNDNIFKGWKGCLLEILYCCLEIMFCLSVNLFRIF